MEMYGRDRRKPNSLSIDRLSELPDAILCHILSFLSTKTSVATSILSRRWRFLWAYVPNLVFYFVKNKHIIDRVLLLHKLPSLKSFSIQLHDYVCDEYQVETWIIAAIDRNVQSLHLSVAYRDFMPRRLFTCDTLVELGLYYCGRIPTLQRVCLPRLKNLYLQCVEFEDDESLPCLLSGSLVLEYLRIEANIDVSLTSCYISSPTVKWLHLESLVRSLGPREQGYRLEINTPALEYLSVHDYLSAPVESVDLTSLIAADICNQDEYIVEDDFLCCESLFKLVDSLSNVKCLKLDLSDYATIIDSLLSAWTSSFNNLTKLELSAESCFLSKFLENANNLEILIFRECSLQTEGWYQFQHDFHEQAKGWTEPQQVPKCLLSRLRTIKTINTLCTDDGLEITRYLLRNAEVLKRMDITYPRRIDSKKKNDLLQKISLFERGSKACELAFTEASYEDSFEGYWKGISPSGLTF